MSSSDNFRKQLANFNTSFAKFQKPLTLRQDLRIEHQRQQLAEFKKDFHDKQRGVTVVNELTENDIPVSFRKEDKLNHFDAPCYKKLCNIILSGHFIKRYRKAGKGKWVLAKNVFDPLINSILNSNPPMR